MTSGLAFAAFPTRRWASPTAARNPCAVWDVYVSYCVQHHARPSRTGCLPRPSGKGSWSRSC